MNNQVQYPRYKSNVRFPKKCDLCGESGHLARGCTLNDQSVSQQPKLKQNAVVSYNSSKHKHLTYIFDNINRYKDTTKASIIMSRILQLNTENYDDILIEIEELAFNSFNQLRTFVTKVDTLSEMNTLKNKIEGDMNKFKQYDGTYTVAKFIVANAK
jgi:hypothetical protein